VRPLAATAVATATLDAEGDTSVTCANVVSRGALADATLPSADAPHRQRRSGLEFHATRNYQSGDPVSRIDWRRFAKTNELTTVQYREEQAVRTVLVVDARPVTRVTPTPATRRARNWALTPPSDCSTRWAGRASSPASSRSAWRPTTSSADWTPTTWSGSTPAARVERPHGCRRCSTGCRWL